MSNDNTPEEAATGTQWPLCSHYNKVKTLKGYWVIKLCGEDALGHCELCEMDACTDHMLSYHKHKAGDPKFQQPKSNAQKISR